MKARACAAAFALVVITLAHPAAPPVVRHQPPARHAVTVTETAFAKPAAAAITGSPTSRRGRAYIWATHRRGCWYSWGGTACAPGFDCSGLVVSAYAHVGIHLPRTTEEMLGSAKLKRIPWRDARRGDLVFFGSGHVEIYHWRHVTLGALESGTRVGFHRWYRDSSWAPSGVYKVRDSG